MRLRLLSESTYKHYYRGDGCDRKYVEGLLRDIKSGNYAGRYFATGPLEAATYYNYGGISSLVEVDIKHGLILDGWGEDMFDLVDNTYRWNDEDLEKTIKVVKPYVPARLINKFTNAVRHPSPPYYRTLHAEGIPKDALEAMQEIYDHVKNINKFKGYQVTLPDRDLSFDELRGIYLCEVKDLSMRQLYHNYTAIVVEEIYAKGSELKVGEVLER